MSTPIQPIAAIFTKSIFLLLFFSVSSNLSASTISEVIPIVVADDIAEDYVSFLEHAKLPPEDVHYYGGAYSRRDVIELILFIQALRIGGYKGEITIHPHNNIRRYLRRFTQGEFAAWASPLSLDFIKDPTHVIATEPVTYEGEFEAGLYVMPNNVEALSIRSIKDLKKFCVVSNVLWAADWKTLTELDLPCLHSANRWNLMVEMVKKGRSDITLAPLSNTPNMVLETGRVQLIPIPGIKLALLGDRRWLISKRHPMGLVTHRSLDKGLKVLRKQKVITKAYTESGTWNKKAVNWKLLNFPQPL